MSSAAADALIRAARALELEAKRLRETASRLNAAERQPDEMRKRVKRIHEAAIRARDNGTTSAEAAALGIPPAVLAHMAKRALAHRDKTAREIRDREIRTLARRGLTNAEIALRFGISARTVARALASERWKNA